MLCGHFIGINRLERIKLLQGDPLVEAFGISVKEPETISRFLGNFNHKTTQMLLEECYVKKHQFQSFKKVAYQKQVKIHHHRY